MDREQVKLEYTEGQGWYLPQNAKKYEYKRPTRPNKPYRGKENKNDKDNKTDTNASDSE